MKGINEMNEEDMQSTLQEIKRRCKDNNASAYSETWSMLERLAHAGYLPARDFCASCLEDPRSDWRYVGLMCAGFHYILPPDGAVVRRTQQLLLGDPEPMVRSAAASVLGIRSRWPDTALRAALKDDPDESVRQSAFTAILTLAGATFRMTENVDKRLVAGEIEPTWEEAQRLIKEAGLTPDRQQ